MEIKTAKSRSAERVVQFSIFTANRLGRLYDLTRLLSTNGVHVLALMVLDTTDSAILRIVVDDPEKARELLLAEDFPFTQNNLLVVEVLAADLGRLMAALLEAELNINYLYSFIPHPRGRSLVALNVEDNDLAEQALQRHQFISLRQADISR